MVFISSTYEEVVTRGISNNGNEKKTRVGKQAFGDYDIVLSTYLYMESAQCIANAKFRPMVNFQNW